MAVKLEPIPGSYLIQFCYFILQKEKRHCFHASGRGYCAATIMEKLHSVVETSAINRSLIAWIIALFGLTSLGVLYLILTGVDQSKDFSPALILIGYAPSFAALCVVGFLHGVLVSSGMHWLWLARCCWCS
jgi:hypothetical protein